MKIPLESRAAFPNLPNTAAAARRFVRRTLAEWGLWDPVSAETGEGGETRDPDGTAADIELLTSELVTNALVHAGTGLDVVCRCEPGAWVSVEVEDRHPTRTVPDAPPRRKDLARGRGGRGLALTRVIADAWGVTYARSRKTVWFRIDLRGAAAAPAPPAMIPPAPAEREETTDAWQRRLRDTLEGGGQVTDLLDRVAQVVSGMFGGDAHILLTGADAAHLDLAASSAGASAPPRRVPSGEAFQRPGAVVLDPPGVRAFGGSARSAVVAPLLTGGRTAGALVLVSAREEAFGEPAARALEPVADRVAATLERAWLAEAERAHRGGLSFLAEASDLLSGILDERLIAALTAQLLVPRVAPWSAVYLTGPEGARLAHVCHADERRVDDVRRLLPAGALPAGAVPGMALSLPIRVGPELVGLLLLGGGRAPDSGVVRLAEDLCRRVGRAVHIARRYTREAAISSMLQRSLMPARDATIPGVECAIVYEPAGPDSSVGGDFYDVHQAGQGAWRFALGDACGHGPEAAGVTGMARTTLRLLAREGYGIAATLGRLNRALLDDDGDRDQFLSLVYGELRPAAGGGVSCTIACAGHPPPLRMLADGNVSRIATQQILVGITETPGFFAESFLLRPGDTLVCATDGVTERRHGGRQLDDDDGLAILLSHCRRLGAREIAERLRDATHAFSPDAPIDDIALLVLQPPHTPRPGGA
ncbi:SpoIIE family protein phosphatase [Spongiactinospora sp. TRM90649]|uniref:SpoIIE family protein phosphatase n=1 Tax=Spongiactinospora sp. TRM90649 TaxID=3031114 RepID=UPI0023F840EF|nr:SpoIIE family protein phosphatase [Spongiactinospora sp. TRM90649]MDF5756830.1 SpoIIE family protein phosphatase [Spongiactinospora sp. TRM90649]